MGRWIRDAPAGGVEADQALQALRRRLFARGEPSAIGRFRDVELIGRGGMGVVYRGWDSVLERPVAIKFPRLERGMTPKRFRNEAHAMARLQHPNVVAIYDVGQYADEPYIAMEFIDGPDLATWVQQAPRSVEEILAVFEQAARGLVAAHALGVVHRDLKPSNVLVAADGRVVVADFGLASSLSGSREGGGTPRYMAPEQRDRRAVGPWTDQWALAVTLRETLAQAHGAARPPTPLEGSLARALPRAVRRAMRRALSDQPRDRFDSVAAFLAAWAATKPAGRRTTRPALALASVAALAALVVWSPSTVEDAKPTPSAQPADPTDPRIEDGVSAAREALRAGNVDDAEALALEAILAARDDRGQRALPAVVLGRILLSRGKIDQARPQLETAFFDAVHAEVPPAALESAIVLIDISNRRLEHDEADRWTRHAQAWRDRVDDDGLAVDLALVQGTTARLRGEHEASLKHVNEAWSLLEKDPGHARAYRVLNERGLTQIEMGAYKAAGESFRQAEQSFLSSGRADHPAHAVVLTNLGNAAFYREDYVDARAAYEHAHRLRMRQHGAVHRETAIALMNIGLIDKLQGHLVAAQTRLEQASENLRAALGEQHPDVAMAVGNLATVHADLGEISESVVLNREALSIYEAAWGAEHPRVASQRGNLAEALNSAGRVDEARAQYVRALDVARRSQGPSHPLTTDLQFRLDRLSQTQDAEQR